MRGAAGGLAMRELRLLLHYHESEAPSLEFISSVQTALECALGSAASARLDEAVVHYLRTFEMPADTALRTRVGELLAFHRVPARHELEALERTLEARRPHSHVAWLLAAREALPHTPASTLMRLASLYRFASPMAT